MKNKIKAAAVIILLGIITTPAMHADFTHQADLNKPTAIILFIGDGMGEAHRKAARWFSVGMDGLLNMDAIPVSGWALTNDSLGLVTDSAAAATAIATGQKTYSDRISVSAGLGNLKTILEYAQESGLSVGLISTTEMTHATPAAFGAHVMSRYSTSEIASQMLEIGVNVLLAGGEDDFLPFSEAGCYPNSGHRLDGRNLVAEALDANYIFVCDLKSLEEKVQEGTTHLLGLFADDGMLRPFEPTLPQMTASALKVLTQDPDGFFLMVEGGQIDWAAHENKAEDVIADVLEFDEAVALGLEYAGYNSNTLVIVTADHETGGMSVGMESSGRFNEDGPFYTPDGIPFFVNWTSTDHTGVNVPTLGQGYLAENLSGTYENTHIFEVMMEVLGLELSRME